MGTPSPLIATGGKRYVESGRTSERRSTTTRPRAASGLRRFLVAAAVAGALFAAFGYALGPETERSLRQIRSLVATSEPTVMLRAERRTAEASDKIVDDVADRSGMPSLIVGLAALVIIAASAFLYTPGRHPRTKSQRGPNR